LVIIHTDSTKLCGSYINFVKSNKSECVEKYVLKNVLLKLFIINHILVLVSI
jgi:hypothetical protein